ncbi:MAG: hypothetical protein Q8O25_02330 [Sulfurisoma sp.]|nr:hypothetical protein [Sulfurisoma sp.]
MIFALVGEFLSNALKYASVDQPISLEIKVGENGLEISCRNVVNPASAIPVLGGKTGLSFIHEVCKLIGAEFDVPGIINNMLVLRALLPIK